MVVWVSTIFETIFTVKDAVEKRAPVEYAIPRKSKRDGNSSMSDSSMDFAKLEWLGNQKSTFQGPQVAFFVAETLCLLIRAKNYCTLSCLTGFRRFFLLCCLSCDSHGTLC